MRRRGGFIDPSNWVGRWRLPRCHAIRTSVRSASARISISASDAASTRTMLPSSRVRPSPSCRCTARGMSSSTLLPPAVLNTIRRRERRSSSSRRTSLAPSAFPLMTPTILRIRSSPSIQKIALGERQLGRRLADEQLAVGAHLIGFGIDLDVRQRVVQLHLGLAYPACVPDGQHHPVEPQRSEEHTSELQSLMRISYAV